MAIIDRHIKVATDLVANYDYTEPFHHYLTSFFRQNKKMGSRDRKTVREACYSYFRFGNSLLEYSIEDKIRISFWYKGIIDECLIPNLKNKENLEALFEESKNKFQDFFPCSAQISNTINYDNFCKNHLTAGEVFFRKTNKALNNKVDAFKEINYQSVEDNAFTVESATSLNSLVDQGLVQIQDLAAQRICKEIQIGDTCWDVCAGAGGKSLHLQGLHPKSRIFVSDIRKSSINNLQIRAAKQGLDTMPSSVLNLEDSHSQIIFKNNFGEVQVNDGYFDTIIADVPCSGSGVWRRTPENIIGYDCSKTEHYVHLQRKIIKNSLSFFKNGGTLHYITCSVFKSENEGQIPFFEELGLTVVRTKYYDAQNEGGDILFHSELRLK